MMSKVRTFMCGASGGKSNRGEARTTSKVVQPFALECIGLERS